jgi:protease-4
MRDRTILWVFLAFVLGFVLPVCSCAGTGLLAITALGSLTSEPIATTIGTGDAVGVISLDGVISSNNADDYFTSQGITPGRVTELLEQAAANPDIKAVVVRVNSPGGSAVASNEIYHRLLDFEKPVVVWMGEIAASGGYYIACGADYTFAHPDTLTGSIGVISQFINVEDLMDEVGIDVMVITSGPYKDLGSSFRGMTEEEKALWQTIITETYEEFVEVVTKARDLPIEEVRAIADGRIYTGRQALELGMVDDVGRLDNAIARAAELGGIEGEPRVIELESVPTLFDMMGGLQSRSQVPSLEEILGWAGAPSIQYRFIAP